MHRSYFTSSQNWQSSRQHVDKCWSNLPKLTRCRRQNVYCLVFWIFDIFIFSISSCNGLFLRIAATAGNFAVKPQAELHHGFFAFACQFGRLSGRVFCLSQQRRDILQWRIFSVTMTSSLSHPSQGVLLWDAFCFDVSLRFSRILSTSFPIFSIVMPHKLSRRVSCGFQLQCAQSRISCARHRKYKSVEEVFEWGAYFRRDEIWKQGCKSW